MREVKSKIEEFKEIIIDKVDNYGCTSMAIYKFIQKKGYNGGYHTVNNFIKKHKNDEIRKATIRFETNPGFQAQIDWKESLRVKSFLLKICSRVMYGIEYPERIDFCLGLYF